MDDGRGSFRDDVRALLRDRALDAARDITTARGWSAVTMGAVAKQVGVSRQHLYNEVGNKQELGDAMVGRETDDFLALMREQVRLNPDDLPAGVAAAARTAFDYGSHNTLLKAIVVVEEGRGDSLLPLLASRPDAVLARAKQAFAEEVHAVHPDLELSSRTLDRLVDGCIRLILSHLTQPNGPAEEAVEQTRALASGFIALDRASPVEQDDG